MAEADKITLSKYEVSVIGMLGITLFSTFGVLEVQVVRDIINDEINNLRIYFVTALVFLLMLMITSVLCKGFAREIHISTKIYIVANVVLFAIVIALLVKCYLNSSTVYPALSGQWLVWHSKTNWKMFVLMTGISVLGIAVDLLMERQHKIIEILRYPAYLGASFIAGFSVYCGNFLVSDKLHGNAYFTSIYNALMDAPYDYSNRSIYGHYAILLKYPIKLLGGSYTAYNIVISIVGGISLLVVALALDKCLKNHFISVIGVWAVPVMYLYYPLNHWQMFPHRVLFAGVELYLLVFFFHKKNKWIKPLGYLICSLALLWNVETGIVCLAVWALAAIVHDIFFEKTVLKIKELFCSLTQNAACSILSLIGMVLFFNLYNMPLGEKWHGLRFLLFPHLSTWDAPEKIVAYAAENNNLSESSNMIGAIKSLDSGFASGLSMHFPLQISPWYFVFLLMGVAVILLLVRRLYLRDDSNDYVMGMAAILAMGQLVYFVNRPCFDYLAIALPEAVLIMGILADEGSTHEGTLWKTGRAYRMLQVAILSVMSVLSVWQFFYRFEERKKIEYYDQEKFDILLEDITATVPKDTVAMGQGIQEIYAQLGWDTGSYFIDCSSLGGNYHSLATIIVEISAQSECVISVREKIMDEKVTAQQYMGYWGFPEEAVTVKKQWEMGTDSGSYWDIYYIGIDQNIENPLIKQFAEIYCRDKEEQR